jgi:hypothetical protein
VRPISRRLIGVVIGNWAVSIKGRTCGFDIK